MNSKAILIGLDGATFTVLDRLMQSGDMPFLHALTQAGVRAPLRTIIPPLTPPAWTSMLTGRSPGHHGIFDFFQLDKPGSKQIRLATSGDIRCETIGHIANRQGRRATVLNFPVHFPTPNLDGYVIAGWMPWRQLRLSCHPSTLYDSLKALPNFNARELAMDMALEARATEGCDQDEYLEWVETHIRREQQWLSVLDHLMTTDPTDLTAILLDGPDKIQHLCWRFLEPTLWPAHPTEQEEQIRHLCHEYFRQLDQVIAAIVEKAGEDATIVLASDHGFGTTTDVFHINSWLEKAGYLRWSDQAEQVDDEDGILGMGKLSHHTQWLDWKETKAYASTPTSNGIHIVMAEHNDGYGIKPEEYDSFRARLIDDLKNLQDPSTGKPLITTISTRESAFDGPAAALAPDLTLALHDGGLVSILPSDQIIKARSEPTGTHHPLGVFIAHGPGIRQGVELDELSILDVAPMLLYGLGMGIPDDLEGRMPEEIYDPIFRTQHPIERLATQADDYGLQFEPPQPTLLDEEAEAAIATRMRALGYIE